MTKLFKNIRKSLLAEGRTTKYLKYAIGEIVLVVIGILIAINLNDKNEIRNEKKLVEFKLLQLRQEVFEDSLEIDQMIKFYDSRIKITNSLLKKINNYQPNTACDSIIFLLNEFEQIRNVVAKTGTYNDMLNTGLFSKIDNNQLKQNIVDYYKFQSNFNDVTWDYVKQFRDIKNDLIKKQIFKLRYHQQTKLFSYNDYCDYINSICLDSNNKIALENYIYKGLETQKGIKDFYSILNNYFIKGIPKKPN